MFLMNRQCGNVSLDRNGVCFGVGGLEFTEVTVAVERISDGVLTGKSMWRLAWIWLP